MSTLEEEIRDLKAEIVKNTVRFDKAVDDGNEGREERYANLIIAKETRLNTLLQQQSQAQAQAGEGQAAFVKSEDGTRYKSARHSGVLPNSTYSPMSYTPNTEAFLTTNEDALYYFNLIKKAFSRINYGKHPKDQFHLKLSGGRFEIAKGNFTVVQINNVTTAITLSNLYHVLKAMECDMDGLVVYLKEFGVPTLIVATRTGNTPPYDAVDFELDGLDDNAQTCHL